MRYNPKLHEYDRYEVRDENSLLEWLLKNVKGSKNKIKATLTGRGVRVNSKVVTQFDYQLHRGDHIAISKSKQNDKFKSRYVKILYEDKWIIVIEKNIGSADFSGWWQWIIMNKVVPLPYGTDQATTCHPSGCAYRQLRCCKL